MAEPNYVTVSFLDSDGKQPPANGWPSRAKFTYFSHIAGLAVGDILVVEVGDGGRFKLVKVVDADPGDRFRERATKWIVDKVDLDVHRARSALIKSMEGDEET